MARIKYGSLINEISGSIGSATFQKSNFGNTLRSKPRSRKSSSSSQMICRNYMMQLHQAWAALTDAQRTKWNQFISFSGATIRREKGISLTGHSLFIQYNFLRLLSQIAILTDFDYVTIASFPVPYGISRDGTDLNFVLTDNYNSNVIWSVLKASAPQRSSRAFNPVYIRFILNPWTNTNTSVINMVPGYANVFGALPPVGSYIHYTVQFFCMTAPVLSQKLSGVFIVEAP
jgi:hypothetical protein